MFNLLKKFLQTHSAKEDDHPAMGDFVVYIYRRPRFCGQSLNAAVVRAGTAWPRKGQEDIQVLRSYPVTL